MTFPSFNRMFFNHYLVQFYVAFPQIHILVLVLSLATSHASGQEKGHFGRQEEKDGKVEELLKFFFLEPPILHISSVPVIHPNCN